MFKFLKHRRIREQTEETKSTSIQMQDIQRRNSLSFVQRIDKKMICKINKQINTSS